MDLLGGYGSGSESSETEAGAEERPQSAAPVSASLEHSEPAVDPNLVNPEDTAKLLAKLPPPKSRQRKPVQFRVPLSVDLAPDSDDEDRPKKKAKVSSKGTRLVDFLPPPRQAGGSRAAVGLLGSGVVSKGTGKKVGGDVSDGDMAGPDPYSNEPLVLGEALDNEAYRINDDPADLPGVSHDQAAYDSAATYNDGGQLGNGGAQYGSNQYQSAAEATAGDQLLQQALQEEAGKASRHGAGSDPFANINFVEVNQQKLKYVNPAQREAANATRTALGKDYEAKLRQEAGPDPDKVSRRKHQINSLYHQAKMKELEMMDMRGQGLKTKAETQAKYGW